MAVAYITNLQGFGCHCGNVENFTKKRPIDTFCSKERLIFSFGKKLSQCVDRIALAGRLTSKIFF